MRLVGRWDYHNELSSQFPLAPVRVLYAASGTLPCALVIRDTDTIVEHGIYWGQGADLLETRVWDGLSGRVIAASYSASRSFRTAAI